MYIQPCTALHGLALDPKLGYLLCPVRSCSILQSTRACAMGSALRQATAATDCDYTHTLWHRSTLESRMDSGSHVLGSKSEVRMIYERRPLCCL